jgi:thiamine biosynthesis lipoprotein
LLALVPLENEAMSVSAVWGRHFQNDGKSYGHVIDPRTGFPTEVAQMTAVVLESATETDALSTALLTQGVDGIEPLHQLRPSARSLVIAGGNSAQKISTHGIEAIA